VADQPLPNLPGQSFEHFYFSLQAAVAGLGIAIGPWHLVQDDLASGQLAAPFGFVPDGSSYHLLSASALPEFGPALALCTWLRSLDAPDQGQKAP
jgi:DNA-binding transcriptional LysR family regulator